MSSSKISKVRVYAVGPSDTQKWTWATNLPEQYLTNNIVRLYAEDGSEGFGGSISAAMNNYDLAIAELLRPAIRSLVGRLPSEREAVQLIIDDRGVQHSPQAAGAIDAAMWDLAGKQAGLPVYDMLGRMRTKMPCYASTPMLGSAQEYVDFVGELIEQGFKAIKFHCWCEYEKDREMVIAVHKKHGDKGIRFMLDTELRYTRDEALKMALLLEELDYEWFEAPLHDTDLHGYAELRRKTNVKILPGGNYLLHPELMVKGLEMGCWSSMRCETTFSGGLTGTNKVFHLADAFGMNVELQTWGYTLTQAAGLHLELSHANCQYFELTVPYDAYEFGCLNPFRTDKDGFVAAPEGPGLGIELDWELIEAASILTFEDDGKECRILKSPY